MKTLRLLFFFFAISFFISCSQNKEEIDLKFCPKVGDQLTFVCQVVTSGNEEMSMKSIIVVRFKVASKDNENVYTLTSNIRNIKSETKMFGAVEKYDSTKDESLMSNEERSMHQEFKNALASTFEIRIDEKGNVVEPFHAIDGNPSTADIIEMNNIQLVFPKEKVKVGSEWKNEKTIPLFEQILKSTYTIKDITENEVIISVDAEIDGASELFGKSKVDGEYILNKKDGTLIKGTLEMDLQMGGKVINTYYREMSKQ